MYIVQKIHTCKYLVYSPHVVHKETLVETERSCMPPPVTEDRKPLCNKGHMQWKEGLYKKVFIRAVR